MGRLLANDPNTIPFVFRVLALILLPEDHDISSSIADLIWLVWRLIFPVLRMTPYLYINETNSVVVRPPISADISTTVRCLR